MASGDVLPRFFSVYLSQYSSESFLIPSSYYEHLPRPLPKTAILMGDGGKIWQVAMTSRQDQVYFEQGWSTFVRDNDLKDGEFLTFVFDGHRRFVVIIYGLGGCKEIRAVVEVEVEEISDGTENDNTTDELDDSIIQEEEINDETTVDIQDITEPSVECDDDDVLLNTDVTSKRTGVDTIQNPQAYLDDPDKICFETRLKKRNYDLLVHAWLVKDYDLKFGNNVDYIDKFGTLTGKTIIWTNQSLLIKNWHKICRRNKVKTNDRILCELVRAEDKVVREIKVHIIRGGAGST